MDIRDGLNVGWMGGFNDGWLDRSDGWIKWLINREGMDRLMV